MFRRPDGIVDFDKSACIGCKACIAACPYDAIFINPEDHSAEKCNFCAHRIDLGLEPACVVVCPTQAILVGDLADPTTEVARIVNREPVQVRRPEKETRPKLFYKGAHQATLDPLAAGRPEGGLFAFAEQGRLAGQVTSGHPLGWNSSAAAILSYDVPRAAPWDWRVSAYTWTKSIAAGAYLVPLLLALGGWLEWTNTLWLSVAPVLAGAFLAATALLLIWDLEHPERFYFIFTRPQWRSWLVRGGVILGLYALVLAGHFLAALAAALATPQGAAAVTRVLAVAGAPLAVMTAVYTAYLFAQSKGRDLWQSPLLPAHLLVQALLAGSAALLLFGAAQRDVAATALKWLLTLASLAHLLLVAGETTLTHATAHARLALREMTRGRYRHHFRAGVALVAAAAPAPALGPWVAVAALAGLFLHEHAYVQAAQAVPQA
jgi:formate-dependent nitrite reductase membrane component NrfD/ferredoxin